MFSSFPHHQQKSCACSSGNNRTLPTHALAASGGKLLCSWTWLTNSVYIYVLHSKHRICLVVCLFVFLAPPSLNSPHADVIGVSLLRGCVYFKMTSIIIVVLNFLNDDICSETRDSEPLTLSYLNKGQHKPVHHEPSEEIGGLQHRSNWSCFFITQFQNQGNISKLAKTKYNCNL